MEDLADWQDKKIFDTFCTYCERFELLDMISEAIVILDAGNGGILFINEAARRLYGYGSDEIRDLTLDAFTLPEAASFRSRLDEVRDAGAEGICFSELHRSMDGHIFRAQFTARALKLHGTDVLVLICRDVTQETLLQEELKLAGKVQRDRLPADFDNATATMRGIYRPYGHVSGDSYDFKWHADKKVLYGYVLDVMGHGVATALQTSALQVLFRRALEPGTTLAQKLEWINKEAAGYFAEDSFAAAIMLALDFEKGRLSYAAAGINHFLAAQGDNWRWESVPGCYLGVTPEASFEQHSIHFLPGDGFIFLSDGLQEIIPGLPVGDFGTVFANLDKLSTSSPRRDDATAMGFHIK